MILMNTALSSLLAVLATGDGASAYAATQAATSSAAEPVAASLAEARPSRHSGAAKTVYVCPMHPEVTSDVPGLCPKCNMKLDPKPQVTELRADHVHRRAGGTTL